MISIRIVLRKKILYWKYFLYSEQVQNFKSSYVSSGDLKRVVIELAIIGNFKWREKYW